MMSQEFAYKLEQILGEEQILREEPMRLHTTFRIGGPAQFFVIPRTQEEAAAAVCLCRSEGAPYYIIGNGSNLLVSDKGYRGVVIQLFKEFSDINIEGTRIRAQAGASLAKIAAEALRAGLAGFEFAAGIPGTLGGACIMNAGAYGGEMKDVLLAVTVLTKDGEIREIPREELDMGYRTSRASREGWIVLGAAIELARGDEKEIRAKMEDLKQRRTDKQPLEYPSAGSTFKRPEGYFAGKLIQDAGLKGYTVGGAQVSEKHSGFVINRGNATAEEVLFLIRQVRKKVKQQFGVEMEPEVRMLGFTDTEVKK